MDQKVNTDIGAPVLTSKRKFLDGKWGLSFLWYTLLTIIAAAISSCVYVSYQNLSRPSGLRLGSTWFGEVTDVFPTIGTLFFLGLVSGWLVAFLFEKISPGFINRLLNRGEETSKPQSLIEFLKARARLTKVEAAEADKFAVTEEVGRRVEALRARTRLILAAMAVSLVAAAIIVLFAGRLTSLDATAVSNIDRLKTDITETKRRLSKLYQSETLYRQYEAAAKAGVAKDVFDRLDKQIAGLRDDAQSPQDLLSTDVMIDLEKTDLTKLSTLLNSAWERELSSEKGNGDWKYIVATAITRVGVVLVIVYLVQILMNFYRYNTRLITYYNSRRDLLMLWDGKQRDLKNLEMALAPSRIDFGKEPKHPLEDIIKAAGAKLAAVAAREKKLPAAI
jgi:hypothetical protein